MIDPLQLPIPTDPAQRIRALARDLAYYAVRGEWSSNFTISGYPSSLWFNKWRLTKEGGVSVYLETKWRGTHPPSSLLVSFGYLTQGTAAEEFILTEKAFALLEQPAVTAKIFISYSRQESSAFALLILARLKNAGLDAFLDMQDITPGEDWAARLQNEVKSREYFICLLGPRTLQSKYVREEINWALASPAIHAIPIWHNGFTYRGGDDDPAIHSFLSSKNAIIVDKENTREYNDAVILLLNYFGYTPA